MAIGCVEYVLGIQSYKHCVAGILEGAVTFLLILSFAYMVLHCFIIGEEEMAKLREII
jgi:hypothetical protein